MNKSGLSDDKVYVDDLTWREQEVLSLLAERLTNREIAECLHLAESTVKDYVGNILSKLYVKNRREAVEKAQELGILKTAEDRVGRPPTNIPAQSTPFFGRKSELAEIKRLLGETRLLTLTGPGGIGKTRLALRVAEEERDNFRGGSFFIALAPLRTGDHLIQTIAEALRFPLATHEDPNRQILRFLKDKIILLVLDNFEHLLSSAKVVSNILEAAPLVKIIATSREKLNLSGEAIQIVGGLEFPEESRSEALGKYDSVTMFIQRARQVRPGFEPSPPELEEIGKICHLVQGMPLAIELAAAWLHILSVEEIFRETERGLDILVGELRDAPERHLSIRAVFQHSWSLLDQDERDIVMRLAVFRGGFRREAAQEVSGATLQQLAELANKSFLSHNPESGRLEIHELLRQYAQERLEEVPQACIAAQDAHAAYFGEFMRQGWQHLKGSGQMVALAEIEADIENVRAAWQYCLDQRNTPQLWNFIYGLWHVYWIRWWNHAGMELFGEAVRRLDGEDDRELVAIRALAMAYQSYFMAWLGLAKQGYAIAADSVTSLEQLNQPQALVFAYDSLGVNAYFLHRYIEEAQAINQMVEIAREMGDTWLLAFALFGASMVALIQEDYDKAHRLAKTNLFLYEEIGDVIGSTTPLIVLGHVALAQDHLEEAREFYLRCLTLSQQTGFHYAIQTSTKYLGKVSLSLGRIAEAEKYLIQSLKITKEIGFVRDIVNLLYEFARLRIALGNLEEAVEFLAFIIQHPASQLYRMLEGRIRDSAKDLLETLQSELDSESFAAALRRGEALDLEEVVDDLITPGSPD